MQRTAIGTAIGALIGAITGGGQGAAIGCSRWGRRGPVSLGKLSFRGNGSSLDRSGQTVLESAAAYLQQHSRLNLEVIRTPKSRDDATTAQERFAAIRDYLSVHSQVPSDRIVLTQDEEGANVWRVNLGLVE